MFQSDSASLQFGQLKIMIEKIGLMKISIV